jgi:hypothetical protein
MHANPTSSQAATCNFTVGGSTAPNPPNSVVNPAETIREYSNEKLAGGTTGSTQKLIPKRSCVHGGDDGSGGNANT